MSCALFSLACEMEILQMECYKQTHWMSLWMRNATEAHFHTAHLRPSTTMMQTSTIFPQSFPPNIFQSPSLQKREFPDALLSSPPPTLIPSVCNYMIPLVSWPGLQKPITGLLAACPQPDGTHCFFFFGFFLWLFLIIKVPFKTSPAPRQCHSRVQRGRVVTREERPGVRRSPHTYTHPAVPGPPLATPQDQPHCRGPDCCHLSQVRAHSLGAWPYLFLLILWVEGHWVYFGLLWTWDLIELS